MLQLTTVWDYTERSTEEEMRLCSLDRVERFSATTVPFPASENAVVRWFPHVSFCAYTFHPIYAASPVSSLAERSVLVLHTNVSSPLKEFEWNKIEPYMY
jgi:hypothetical protein